MAAWTISLRLTLSGVRKMVNENYFKYLVNSMRSGVITINLDGDIQIINNVAQEIIKYEGDPVGKHCKHVLSDYPEIANLLIGAFEFNYLPDRAEIEIKRKNQKSKIIGFTLSLISDDRGVIMGSALFFKDLTRMEQLREQEKLKDRLAALGQMAAALAHEIRNPLAGIEITAGLLRRRTSEYSLIDKIINEVRTLNQMVTECLEFVKPVKLNRKRVNLREILEEAIELSGSFYAGKPITFKSDLNYVPEIIADSDQIKNMFLNLIRNACESIENQGEVIVSLKQKKHPEYSEDNSVVVEVKDNGRGINKKIINKIFNPFFTTKETGTGIGLSMVQKIIDAHEGRMDLESEEGVGSHFFVYLPVRL